MVLVLVVLICGAVLTDFKDLIVKAEPPKQDAFRISHVAGSLVKTDCSNGDSWMLRRRTDGGVDWQPIPSLKSEESATQDLQESTEIAHASEDISTSMPLDKLLIAQGYLKIKLHQMNAGYLSVKAKANGHDLTLIVDTGATITHLDRQRTERLELAWKERDGISGRGAPSESYSYTTLESFDIDQLKNSNLKIVEHDFTYTNSCLAAYGDPPVDGILGADVMSQGLGIIDYKTHSLYLRDPSLAD
jgi:hypothetical protein